MKKILVMFSGGQDSTTCLAYHMNLCKDVHCITFDYNQLHQSEINSALKISKKLGIKKHIVLDIKYLQNISLSSLTNNKISLQTHHPVDHLFPSTFVPGRNILFLTLSSIYAYSHQITSIVLGVNEIDFSGYPDCRDEFIQSMNRTIQIGMNFDIRFITPLMNLSKPEIWSLSDYFNITDTILSDTVTCYNGIKGIGCRTCQACVIRQKGFDEWNSNRSYYMQSMQKKMKL